MSSVPDFTEAEQWAVETTLKERWPEQTPAIPLADVEIRMHPQDPELTVYPAVFREHSTTRFAMIKVTDRAGRSRFYDCGFQQYGTVRTTTTTLPNAWQPSCRCTQTRKPGTAKNQPEQHTEFKQ